MGSNLFHYHQIKNPQGFSLIEILVAIGIAGFIALGNMIFLNDFLHRLKIYENSSDEETEIALTNTLTTNIIKKSHLSLNRIGLKDDNGNSFFDYYPDVPSTAIPNGRRQFSLNASQREDKYFYLLVSEEADYDSIILDPVHAYTETTTPADLLADGKITYRGINSVPAIRDTNGVAAKDKLMDKIFQKRWSQGELFVLTCPTYLRPLIGNSLSLLTPPRPASYIGRVTGDDLTPLPQLGSDIHLLNVHPVTNSAYKNVDQFLRSLPTVGGAAPFIKVEPAKLVRLEMRRNPAYKNEYADLTMSTWRKGQFEGSQTLALKIRTANFTRSTVTMPVISLEILK